MKKLIILFIVMLALLFFMPYFVKKATIQKGKEGMKFHDNIIALTKQNNDYRKEIVTASYSQIVLVSIRPQEEIGQEVHHETDQILIFVSGTGQAIVNGEKSPIGSGDLILIRAGTQHNIINTGNEDLKLYTIYAPPHHKPGIIHTTKAAANRAYE